MAIDPKFIEELKNKNDIVDVVGKYCALEQRGGSFWARCPLPGHSERTPSFSVNQYGQFYKCFGCGRGGDAIKFIMEMESMPYIDAVRFLAEKSGMTLPDTLMDERRTSEEYKKKDTMLSILRDTAKFYVANLRSGNADEHKAYIAKRGLTKETVTAFGIGASLDYYSLPEYLKGKGYNYEDMLAAGVIAKHENRNTGREEYIDFEAKRLVFPTINALGEVIAFCGRALEKVDFQKYKNTRETYLFSKSKTLYNINRIKKLKAAGPIKEIIMVEGQMDAVSLSSAGFENVVASMGTSLTKEQARLIKRYTENVLISYDGDFAGQAANIRGLEILKSEGLNVKVVTLPEGLDPDDVIRKHGAEEYRRLLGEALPLVDYKIKILYNKFMDGSEEGRRKYIAEAVKVISESPSDAEREDLVKKVSKETGITFQSINRDLEKIRNGAEAALNKKPAALSERSRTENALAMAEKFVLARVLCSARRPLPDYFDFSEIVFTDPHRQEIAAYLSDKLAGGVKINPSSLYEFVSEEDRPEAEDILFMIGSPALENDAEEKYFNDCVKRIKDEGLKRKIAELSSLFQNESDSAKRMEISREINELMKRMKKR